MSEPETLGEYLQIAKMLFGEDSPAVDFMNEKIEESPNGEDEKVITHSSQMLYLLATMGSKTK